MHRSYECVDTGSNFTWLPARFREIAVEPAVDQTFVLANGTREVRSLAQVRIRLEGQTFFTYCGFAEGDDQLLLGAVALEEARLAVDPLNRRLVRADSFRL